MTVAWRFVLCVLSVLFVGDGLRAGTWFSLEGLLAGDATGFERAAEGRHFDFAQDHGPHPGYRTEWWYFTGNLETSAGRHFGYQLTFFRFQLVPEPASRTSAWAVRQAYMAHFTLTDTESGAFHAFERFSRDGLGLAGAAGSPFRVWLHDWQAASEGSEFFPVRLSARDGAAGIDLVIAGGKPWVLQGEGGLSRKSAAPGNASYYYSGTRLDTRGTVAIGGAQYAVSGSSWLDREWGTSSLGEGQSGWDWFALQLSGGTDLMYYRLRRDDGTSDPHSAGVMVGPDGTVVRLSSEQVRLTVLEYWRSPATGVSYPLAWGLEVPGQALALEVTPRLRGQELDLSVRYWEGAVSVRGRRGGSPVAGSGYLELAGYPD